ncbi:trans-aconitate 2-methyltransferase [mine drainage metagenome]|uniref:Trans-aconitate 2-methyltransferase n=1 Tax=mine drainage metagenome TaxID=410659 RepID=A0A1J5RKM2_9ZZZZ
MTWNPRQYLRYGDQRLRPALELLARIPLEAPAGIVDLGCGPGNVTPYLQARWPEARLTGVDSSAEMLEAAGAALPGAAWIQADAAAWRPETPPDLIYANASLHWLDDHAALFPRLFGLLAPGGVLAVQMPRNFQAPSHTEMRALAANGPWRDRLAPLLRPDPVAAPAFYWDLLRPLGAAVDIWETEYLQGLRGEDAVLQWMLGTSLKPLADALPPDQRALFLERLGARLALAYPRRNDGLTLYPFRRLFLVAGQDRL